MRLGVTGNLAYRDLRAVLRRVLAAADRLGVEALPGRAEAELLEAGEAPGLLDDAWESLDALLTLGGDGTLLRGARTAGPLGIPVAGCNLGRLGFLTAAPLEELEETLERLVACDFRTEERLALDVGILSSDAPACADPDTPLPAAGSPRGASPEGTSAASLFPNARSGNPGTAEVRDATEGTGADGTPGGGGPRFYALNDAVVHKSGFARLITLRVWVGREEVGQYSADGIVLATATGSTAYSLSAGGPVMVPTLDAIVATPISPHTLAVRPLVLPADLEVTVEVCARSDETVLTVDGQSGRELSPGDRVRVRRSPHPVRLIHFPERSFFSVLRRKLHWGDVRPTDG